MAETALTPLPPAPLPKGEGRRLLSPVARPAPAAYPLAMVMSRSLFIFLAQALVALLFWLGGSDHPWMAAAPWWTVFGTLADLGCLALLV